MKVKPLKIKIKEPTPSAADRMNARHQAIRKEKGLPDPSEYKKKLDAMKSEEVEQLDEIGNTPAGRKVLGNYINRSHESGDAARIMTAYDKDNFQKHAKTVAKRSSGIAKAVTRLVKQEETKSSKVFEQHINGRFYPTKPRNVRNTPTASPRQSSDSADVRLKEAKMTWDDMMTKDGPAPKPSRKAEIVRSAAKKKTNSMDQFQANPILDSDVNPQTNKQ